MDVPNVRSRLQASLASATERYPSLPYLGFSLWLAWQRLMWSTGISQIGLLELPPSLVMHLVVNGALLACIFGCAALDLRLRSIVHGHPLAWGTLASMLGSIAAIAAMALGLPVPLFLGGCLLAGFGMGILLIHAMELFGSIAPSKLLLLTGASWGIAATVNLVVSSFGILVTRIIFCLLPLLATACFATGLASPSPSQQFGHTNNQQPPLPRSFWALAFTVFTVSLVAQSVIYFNGEHYGASERHVASAAVDGVVTLIALGLVAYAILRPRSHDYGALYYPAVFGVIGLLTLLFIAPSHTVAPLVASRVVFQVFGLILWCLLHCIASQSGSSAIKVYELGYGLHMLGSILGYGVGYLLNEAHPWADSAMLFWYIGTAILVLAICVAVYPPRTMRDLLLSIPLDDVAEPQHPSEPDAWLAACEATAREGGLTDREREVMLFLARGRGSAHIAKSLNVSLSTTYTHTRNIYRKLDVHSREELMALVDTHLSD